MKLSIVRFVGFLNIFLFICTPLYIIDEMEERGKVETGAKNNMEMRRLEKERVPDLFVATTKKKQFYVFSEASVNRGSLFISADVEKFIIRFSSLGFLPFRTTGFDKRSSFTYKAQSYKRLVYLDLRILLLRFLNGCNLPVFYKKKKKKFHSKLSRASIFAYECSFLPFPLSLVRNAQAERLDIVLTGET